MKNIVFLIVGIWFGIVMTKSEAISWFRIHEMFRFESIHMYGIIGVAVILGATAIFLLKKFKVKTLSGEPVSYTPMELNVKRYLLSGTIFGLGWAIVGACPGPMYVLVGQGYWFIIVIMLSAILGTYTYGAVRDKLPH